jgi:hypothetical protein
LNPLRPLLLAGAATLVMSCGGAGPGPTGTVSCQPFGSTPAPIPFSFPAGPVNEPSAGATAVALFRSCALPNAIIDDLTSRVAPVSGVRGGPNEGQSVWQVQVDATITEPGGTRYLSHFLIEVNQVTGVPTIIGMG